MTTPAPYGYLTCHGGVGAATGANFLIEFGDKRVLVDCGFLQGVPGADEFNASTFPYAARSIHTLFVTHAHADHIGRIPKLVRDGFRGEILSTPATRDLARAMLEDAANLIMREANDTRSEPLYVMADVQQAFSLWKTQEYYAPFGLFAGAAVSDQVKSIQVRFVDAGHILGSAIVEMTLHCQDGEERKLVCTGDLGNSPSLFIRDTDYVTDVSYMVMESVYGDRNHESKEARRGSLERVIQQSIEGKRTLVIPSFSLERTQDILFEINRLVESGAIAPVPVFIDSPLATRVTDVYRRYTSYFREDIQKQINDGDDIFDFTKLRFTARVEDSQQIASVPDPKIIIAGSGMSVGGRIINHEIRYLPDPTATVLFVGYQAVGTLGRRIIDGASAVDINGQHIVIRANIEKIFGYSSHKDSDALLDFAVHAAASGKTKFVFVAMGEPKSSLHLAQRMRGEGIPAQYPDLHKTYPLN